MPNPGKSNLRPKAMQLRVEQNRSLLEIATELGVSIATCSRWLKDYPLPDEERKRRSDIGHQKLQGRKQNPETIRKRVENSREKIRASAIARFGGAWLGAKKAGKPTYCSHKPCRNGHTERYVKSRMCVRCQSDNYRNPKYLANRLCVTARCRAKKDSIPFDLTSDYLRQIWPSNNCCPILQKPFELRRGEKRHGPIPLSPSIDRIIPNMGYIQGNVAILSYKANTIKQDCTDPAVFRRLADWLEANQ